MRGQPMVLEPVPKAANAYLSILLSVEITILANLILTIPDGLMF
jgi:hypothetical protein